MNLRLPATFLGAIRLPAREDFDWISPAALLSLAAIGVAFIFSAQYQVHGSDWIKQILYLVVGAGIYGVVSLIDPRFWMSVAHWIYFACIGMLVMVLVPRIGTSHYGAQRWIDLGPFSIQPSEPAKVSVLLMCASVLMRSKIGGIAQSFTGLLLLAAFAGLPIFLILLQPDLKSAIVLPPMIFAMLYVSRLSARFFAAALAAFLTLVGLVALDSYQYVNYMESNHLSFVSDKGAYEPHGLLPLHDYQRNRIISFAAPDKIDPLGVSWNVNQSLISVGSGGFAGQGWTKGTQAQLGYLPRMAAHNDFIFSVIAEETGFVGSLTVLGLFGVVLFNGIRIAGLARDRFGTLLAVGVTVLFTVHVFVNIAMTIGLVPITGIPLPFISYGGSFVLSCCFLQGLVQSVYRHRMESA